MLQEESESLTIHCKRLCSGVNRHSITSVLFTSLDSEVERLVCERCVMLTLDLRIRSVM